MASFIKEKDIKKLQEAGYLAKEIAHRLPAKGQIVPSPEPPERVVFISTLCLPAGIPSPPVCPQTDVLLRAGLP